MEEEKIQATITEVTPTWKLKLAYFYTEHKIFLRKLGLFSFFFIDLIIIFIFGTILINYQTESLNYESQLRQLPANLVNTQAVKRVAPKKLIIGQVETIQADGVKYNMLARIQNNNTDWAVKKLDYAFSVAGKLLDKQTTFILPKSEKILMQFNAPTETDAKLVILNTSWQRVLDYSLLSYKNGIQVDKTKFTPGRSSQISGLLEVNIVNTTPYSFWEVGLPIVMYDKDSTPIGISYTVVNQLKSQESRLIEIGWHDQLKSRVGKIKAYPEINLLSQDSIMRIKAQRDSPAGLN